jgi:hypothetical protein
MACFENIAIEDLDACINSEVQAGVSEVVYYGVHAQITTFPMPLNVNDVGYDYEGSCSNGPIVFTAGKGFGKITVQSDSGEVVDVVGNKGNKKTKVHLLSTFLVTARNC